MARLPILTPETMLTPAQLAELSEKHDGCMHVIRSTTKELLVQLYPLDDGEAPIAGTVPKADFEFVFRPPTGREVIVFKKKSKTAAAETAGDELFNNAMVHPTREVASVVLDRYTMLYSSKGMLAALMKLAGGEAEFEGKG